MAIFFYYNDAFKNVYGIDFNAQNVEEYYKNPTEENLKKAFGSSRIADIKSRVENYNDSQELGGDVVKGATIAVAAGATGGASVVGFAVASGVATVGADMVGNLTQGEGQEGFDAKENASHLLDTENLEQYGKDAALAAGSAFLGGKVGEQAGKLINGKFVMPKFNDALEKAALNEGIKHGDMIVLDKATSEMIDKSTKAVNLFQKGAKYAADTAASSVSDGIGGAVQGGSFATSFGTSVSGVSGDAILEGGKNVVKNVVKKKI